MGFLDSGGDIIDMVLTREGRRLLAEGRLEFDSFVLFDDEVDYEPYVSTSGSLTVDQLDERVTALIEGTPVFEPVVGLSPSHVVDADNVLAPRSALFDMPQGQTVLPRMSVSPDVTASLVQVRQAVVGSTGLTHAPAIVENARLVQTPMGVIRQKPTVLRFDVSVEDFFDSRRGVAVRLYESGSDGLREVTPVLDYMNELSYGLHLKVAVDEDAKAVSRRAGRGDIKP